MLKGRILVSTDSILSFDKEIIMSRNLRETTQLHHKSHYFIIIHDLTISLITVYSISGESSPLELQDRTCSNGVLSSNGGRLIEVSSLYELYSSEGKRMNH